MCVFCANCNSQIDEEADVTGGRKPCPKCGSTSRRSHLDIAEKLVAGDQLATKEYAAGLSRKKGLRRETKSGASFSTDRKRFMRIDQVVDHENNRYVKTVTDPQTGEVLRKVDEPLTEHTGRGSDKKRDT